MSNKHTQGQWIFGKFNNFEYYDIDCNGNRIASVYCGIDTPQDFQNEAEANAKLIAAAPELLKACINSLEKLKKVSYEDVNIRIITMYLDAAINKSTL